VDINTKGRFPSRLGLISIRKKVSFRLANRGEKIKNYSIKKVTFRLDKKLHSDLIEIVKNNSKADRNKKIKVKLIK
jgi:hypothetical protein